MMQQERAEGFLGNNDQGNSNDYGLTIREMEVFQWLCQGKTNWEIGKILGISAWTAKIHVCNILKKMGVNNRTQAAASMLR